MIRYYHYSRLQKSHDVNKSFDYIRVWSFVNFHRFLIRWQEYIDLPTETPGVMQGTGNYFLMHIASFVIPEYKTCRLLPLYLYFTDNLICMISAIVLFLLTLLVRKERRSTCCTNACVPRKARRLGGSTFIHFDEKLFHRLRSQLITIQADHVKNLGFRMSTLHSGARL